MYESKLGVWLLHTTSSITIGIKCLHLLLESHQFIKGDRVLNCHNTCPDPLGSMEEECCIDDDDSAVTTDDDM